MDTDNQLQPGGIISPTQPPAIGTTSSEASTPPEGRVYETPSTQPVVDPNSALRDTIPVAEDHNTATVQLSEQAEVPEALAAPVTPDSLDGGTTTQPVVGEAPETLAQADPQSAVPQPILTSQPQAMPSFMNPGATVAEPGTLAAAAPKKFPATKKLRPFLIILAGIVLVGGASTAAYFGVILPNKPENKVLSAVADFVSETNVTTEGVINYSSGNSGTALSTTYKVETNTSKNEFSTTGTVGLGIHQYPYEIRYIDKSLYIKVSGLDKAGSQLPASTDFDYSSLLKTVNDQWYVIDSSFADSLGIKTSCYTDISFALSKNDISLIKSTYKQHPLFKIKSTSQEIIDGAATTKFTVDPTSDSEASAFANAMKNLSIVKKVKDCAGSTADNLLNSGTIKGTVTSAKDSGTNTISLFVTKNKKLKKVEVLSKDKTTSVKIEAVFSYSPVNITKPDGAKSIKDLYASLFGGGAGASTNGQANSGDAEREADINALHGQIEAYYAQYNNYPSLAEMNDTTFVKTKLLNLDQEILKDPSGSTYTLVATPQAGRYSYAVKPINCDNGSKGDCTSYVLTATLSDGAVYSKENLSN